MIRDILRAALVVACMTIGAALLVETRYHLAAIDVAHRNATLQAVAPQFTAPQPMSQEQEPSPLRRLGRASLSLADAALGILR